LLVDLLLLVFVFKEAKDPLLKEHLNLALSDVFSLDSDAVFLSSFLN
jgi:hypothetical protein